MKKYIAGIITGIILCSGISYANEPSGLTITTKMNCSIYSNNDKIILDEPILNYSGRAYLPIRKFAEIANIDISWDDLNKSIKINSNKAGSIDFSFLKASPPPTPTSPTLQTESTQNYKISGDLITLKNSLFTYVLNDSMALENSGFKAIKVLNNIDDDKLLVDNNGDSVILEPRGYSYLHFDDGKYYCGELGGYSGYLFDKYGEKVEFYID